MAKKQVKKNTKPIVVDIDDTPLFDTSKLDTAVQVSAPVTKKDGKKVAAPTTSTPTTTTSTPTAASTKPIETPVVVKQEPVTISASSNSNVVIAPAVEATITDDFSVVPEKNKNKKKINATGNDSTTTPTPKPNVPVVNRNVKKGNTAPSSQFHLLSLDEDDLIYDETHTHKEQQHSNKKSSKQQATQSVAPTQTKKPKTKESKEVKPTPTPATKSTTKTEVKQTATKSTPAPVVKSTPTPAPVVKSTPTPVSQLKQSSQQQNKKSEGALFDLMQSLITPGVPSVVYKIIFMCLFGILIFSLVPLYYSGLSSAYSYGILALVLGLGIALTLFISEFSKVQSVKESKSSKGNKKPTSRKLK